MVYRFAVLFVVLLVASCAKECSQASMGASGPALLPAATEKEMVPSPQDPAGPRDTVATDASSAALPAPVSHEPVPAWVHENPESERTCGPRMVLVEGEYFPAAGHVCAEWLDEARDRCARYVEKPITGRKKEKKRFCIDRYEYPNLPGVKPAVMVNWFEAKATCELEGKRLCTSSEWTLTCEGQGLAPYPYGYRRDPQACNIDKPRPVPEPDFEAFSHPRQISAEVARLDLREESGGRARCVSSFGAYDLTGNVDEWVLDEDYDNPNLPEKERHPYVSGLKGGYWGPIRARCRPITTAHNEWFRFYQVGFRCCADAAAR